jgi:hypothetical protein
MIVTPTGQVLTSIGRETVQSLKAYFAVLMIGTDKGLRAAAIGGQAGQLTLGSLIEMALPPRCFETQSRFVFFGWDDYDGEHTGLGRADLSKFNNDVPAYASDLMATTQNAVTSIVTFNGLRLFTVSGHGIYGETTNKVTSGTISSGWLNYALAYPKIALKMSVQYRIGAGTYQASLAKDDAAAVNVGLPVVTSAIAGPVPQIRDGVRDDVRAHPQRRTRPQGQCWIGCADGRTPARTARSSWSGLLHSSQRLVTATVKYVGRERQRFYNLMQDRRSSFQDCGSSRSSSTTSSGCYEQVGVGSWNGTLV